MLFNSFQFAVFFAVVLALYWPTTGRLRTFVLLAAGYVFYGTWDYRFLFLLALSTLIDFVAGILIHGAPDARRRRFFLICSLGANLTILGFFKYFNFFVDSMKALLAAVGIDLHTGTLHIILPVGISFYTFQSMSYAIDVYRGRSAPTRDLLTYATYVAFFPQLVAGPIERFASLYPQIATPRRPDVAMFRRGWFLILQGYVKKVVIADNIAAIVEAAFRDPASQSAGQLLEAALLFTAQIYCDFSGYSEIARGVANLLGVELVLNFRTPLLSRSVTEFWRRWHISLSQWLRDYLYIPLGGNRSGPWRTYANLMTTMLLGGLWHGADWKFVVWGALHGGALAIERMVGVRADEGRRERSLLYLPQTLALVVFAFIFFRADSIHDGWAVVAGIAAGTGLADVLTVRLLWVVLAILCLDLPFYRTDDQTWPMRVSLPARLALYAALLLALVVLGGNRQAPFLYFAF